MSVISEILDHNKTFVDSGEYESLLTDKFPNKKLAILSCMDTRLTELIPAAMNVKNGDVKIIKNAGAIISHPFGSVMRSMLVAVYELGVENIIVLGHTNCGMQNLDTNKMIEKMLDRGISKKQLDTVTASGVDITTWLRGFENTDDSVRKTVKIISEHILMPHDVNVYGFIIDINTGKLTAID